MAALMIPPHRLRVERTEPLQQLSPERVNAVRNISTATTASKDSHTSATENDSDADVYTTRTSNTSSPTRKPNLFADYSPTKHANNIILGGGGLPQSPSLPDMNNLRGHARTNSDVQGLVKRFEILDVRDRDAESSERRRKQEAELRRAQMAREEAESDVRRLREEMRRMRRDGEEGRERERRVGRRLEVVMDELTSAKEQYASQSSMYEKELRRARKEAYKSSSAVIKIQEELKSTRNSLRITHSGFEMEKQKVQRREQETFNAQYQLAGLQEELERLRAQLKIVAEEKEALKTTLKDEDVARVAAEGMIALPISPEDDEPFSSPRKPIVRSPFSDDKENVGPGPRKAMESKRMEEELLNERRRREHAEEMVDFLQLECRFRCCRCRTRHHELELSMSAGLSEAMLDVMGNMKMVFGHRADEMDVEVHSGADRMDIEAKEIVQLELDLVEAEAKEKAAQEEVIGGTEEAVLDPAVEAESTGHGENLLAEEVMLAPHPTPVAPETNEQPETMSVDLSSSNVEIPQQTASQRPHLAMRTITTTTTIPMHFTPIKPIPPFRPTSFGQEDAENIPPTPTNLATDPETTTPTFDRAAALAAIEYRRGRAKSFAAGNLTPRKQMLEGVGTGGRRDISAPAIGGKKSGAVGFSKVCGSVGRAAGRGRGV
ncbi:hypothetical protein LTR62_005796 [Meristemomyces frigidus]|uniref:Uncharacterized protein n=1 Tax=Meristemomyces frigidus TaxID=1508187 RepID=A0AAN7TGJ9_9PEZI|nr:hypothetical protein LTR62_005796 [Meristemomyces frigidus]